MVVSAEEVKETCALCSSLVFILHVFVECIFGVRHCYVLLRIPEWKKQSSSPYDTHFWDIPEVGSYGSWTKSNPCLFSLIVVCLFFGQEEIVVAVVYNFSIGHVYCVWGWLSHIHQEGQPHHSTFIILLSGFCACPHMHPACFSSYQDQDSNHLVSLVKSSLLSHPAINDFKIKFYWNTDTSAHLCIF